MTANAAKLLVLIGEHFACIKIVGRASFTSSIDFKTLVNELIAKGFRFYVLELSQCVLMDSTFLGVLAGFGLKMNSSEQKGARIELLNPRPRISELLESLGVLHLFQVRHGAAPSGTEPEQTREAGNVSREEVTRACLEAHQTLMSINPENVSRFKEVTQFLAEDLKKLNAPQP